VETYRLYIDETGDHRYKQLNQLESRYLGLTGVLIKKEYYDKTIPQALEALKKQFFKYDPDKPPILVRSHILYHKFAFGVLLDDELNAKWETALVNFYKELKAQIFTVVIDKKVHKENYPLQTFDAYVYSLAVLLWRVHGYLSIHKQKAGIMAEARGKVEDASIQSGFDYVREYGFTGYGTPEGYCETYPDPKLKFGTKIQNVAGLQIADLIAYGQKVLTVEENHRPYHKPISRFTKMLNDAIQPKVNRYGRYFLE
jgi:hypothetical protein